MLVHIIQQVICMKIINFLKVMKIKFLYCPNSNMEKNVLRTLTSKTKEHKQFTKICYSRFYDFSAFSGTKNG